MSYVLLDVSTYMQPNWQTFNLFNFNYNLQQTFRRMLAVRKKNLLHWTLLSQWFPSPSSNLEKDWCGSCQSVLRVQLLQTLPRDRCPCIYFSNFKKLWRIKILILYFLKTNIRCSRCLKTRFINFNCVLDFLNDETFPDHKKCNDLPRLL